MRPLIECVPNFSEGRRPEVVRSIIDTVAAVPGVTVLDHGADPDHNRAVLTFVGAPGPVEEAAFRAIERATALIDLNEHEGVHPRIGATDVVPFVPMGDTPMSVCIDVAKRLGERVGRELKLPVYLYEHAAPSAARRELADLRRGGLAGLVRAMETNPEFRPDFGPPQLHPTAGAVAIGARSFLIAFNVDLETDDLEVAMDIARRIRASSGEGLEGVKALGLRLKGRGTTQVSMNLTDYRRASMGKVYRRIEELARDRDVRLRSSELIGLVPREALVRAAEEVLDLDLKRTWVLEDRLREAITGPVLVHGVLEDLASRKPTPGGGAAAALAGALAAATASKVVSIASRKAEEPARKELARLRTRLHELRWELLDLLEQDAAAYRGLVEAGRLPKADDAERRARKEALGRAAEKACAAPLAIAEALRDVLRATRESLEHASRSLAADAVAAAAMARGAIDAAHAMLRVNLPSLTDEARAAELRDRFGAVRAEAREIEDALQEQAFKP